MKTNAIITFVYALTVASGGVIGFVTAGSYPSLIMGSVFGTLLLGSGYAITQKSTLGYFSAVALTAILALFFFYRFATTLKFMPAGLMAVISTLVLAYFFFPRKSSVAS